MPLNLILGLHTLLANPKLGVALSVTSLIILHKTAATTQQTSSPQPLPCDVEADKTHLEFFIYFLESGAW